MGMRQIAALLGLVAMVPVGWMVGTGQLGLAEAGMRAGFVLAGVVLVTWLGRFGVAMLARSMETPRRRRTDVETVNAQQ